MDIGFQFIPGSYYLIVCKAGDYALRIRQNDPEKFRGSQVVGVQPNPQDVGQLFMVEKIGDAPDQYQIINCQSDYLFDQQSGQIKLNKGKQKKDQLFAIRLAPVKQFYRYYWIQTDKQCKKALFLDNTLQYKEFNQNHQNQLFRFQPIVNNNSLLSSAVIVNNYSQTVVDIPKSTRKQGERMLLWTRNGRFNQRWQFQKQGKGTVIRNLGNGLCLDVEGQSKKSGAKVIQWKHTGGLNQQWFIQPSGNGLYRLRCCHEPSLFLAIRKQQKQKGGELQVCSQQNPSMYWRFEGAQPISF